MITQDTTPSWTPCANSVIDPKTCVAMEYRDFLWYPNQKIRAVWQKAAVVEFGRLGGVVDGTNSKGTKMMHFIP